MERAVPRTITEVLPSGAEFTWTEGDDGGERRVAEVLPNGARRFVEALPSGAELSWTEDAAGDVAPPAPEAA